MRRPGEKQPRPAPPGFTDVSALILYPMQAGWWPKLCQIFRGATLTNEAGESRIRRTPHPDQARAKNNAPSWIRGVVYSRIRRLCAEDGEVLMRRFVAECTSFHRRSNSSHPCWTQWCTCRRRSTTSCHSHPWTSWRRICRPCLGSKCHPCSMRHLWRSNLHPCRNTLFCHRPLRDRSKRRIWHYCRPGPTWVETCSGPSKPEP